MSDVRKCQITKRVEYHEGTHQPPHFLQAPALGYPAAMMPSSRVSPGKSIHHGRQSKTRDPTSREPAVECRQAEFPLCEGKGEEGEDDGEDAAEGEALGYCAVG